MDHAPETVTAPLRPRPDFGVDTGLPIGAHADEIAALIRDHQVVVVAGETGSGKTTQLPKIALALGRTRIGHTQPRRLAARSVATRLAAEIDVPLGDLVGYQVRFTREASRATRLKVMTDGIMLAEIGHDKELRRYDTIIIDEAHERNLNIDFLLGYLKQLLPKRPDLKLIITSATIDTARFSEHFGNAPVIEVSGRSYPVEIRYRPLADEDTDQNDAILAAVRELSAEGGGDILVFLAGERDIRDAAEVLTAARLPDTEVLPLYARLSLAEQQRIFSPHAGRRIVLATNVAETSLTVPGVRYVIDPGLARISRYSARTKVQRLPIEAISQASANQRAGRCGRVAPGICIRLYSEDDFRSRPEFTEPEILRTNLAAVILQMAQAGLGDISSFPFVEAPDGSHITDGLRLLDELGALVPGRRQAPKLTKTGRQLAQLPVDPRLGRMLLEGSRRHCLREVLVLVAGLAIQDVRERPSEYRQQADAAHARFASDEALAVALREPVGEPPVAPVSQEPLRYTVHTGRGGMHAEPKPDEGGDLAAMLRLWRYLMGLQGELSGNQLRRRCRQEYINYLRVREWQDLHTQLRQICKELGLNRSSTEAPTSAVLTSMLSGLLSHVGLAELDKPQPQSKGSVGRRQKVSKGPREYQGARGSRFAINPGSVLAKRPPDLVMAVELVETTRLWARTVAGVQPEWIEQVGAHLLKSQYSEPHWSSSSGAVLAYEKVSLYGVPIIADRLINYARIDPVEARSIFITSALVEDAWRPAVGSLSRALADHNRAVRTELDELEERTRRRDLVVPDRVIAEFFADRLPQDVASEATLEAWLKAEAGRVTSLELSLDDLVTPSHDDVDADQFPEQWPIAEFTLPIRYTFEPGTGSDGVQVRIPLAQLAQLPPEPFSWQVPGLRADLATELIRSLPKQIRTSFVPAPDSARAALRWLAANNPDRSRPFSAELSRALRALTGEIVPPDAWRPQAVPPHLQVGFVVEAEGVPDQQSKDLVELQQSLARTVSATLTKAAAHSRIRGTSWIFGTIPRELEVASAGVVARGYPALHDESDAVALVVHDTPASAARSHRAGLTRLLTLVNPDPTRWTVSHLLNADKLALAASPYQSVPHLLADARLKATAALASTLANHDDIRDEAAFNDLAVQVRQQQADQMRRVVEVAADVVRLAGQVRAALEDPAVPSGLRAEVSNQVDNLVFEGFISYTRDPWYERVPRYLQAALARVQAVLENPVRDLRSADTVAEIESEYAALCDRQPPGSIADEIDDIGFLIEELRVQLFAQSLRTSVPVSPSRIRKAIRAVG